MNAAAFDAFDAEFPVEREIRGGYGPYTVGKVHDDSPGPCPECPHATRCNAQSLACEQFAVFVRIGGTQRWRTAARQPSAEIFQRLFC